MKGTLESSNSRSSPIRMQHFACNKPQIMIPAAADRPGRVPLQFQQQESFSAHTASATKDALDGGIDRLDDTEADCVVTIGSDAVDVSPQEVAQSFHLG